jgi:tRNA pseudouridine13 synthase
MAQGVHWEWQATDGQKQTDQSSRDLIIQFELAAGQYATNWLREALELNES